MTPAQRAAIAKSREQAAIARDVRLNDQMLMLRDLDTARHEFLAAWRAACQACGPEVLADELTATGSAMRQIFKLFHGSGA